MAVQPYRQIRPHDPVTCWNCGPDGLGHLACQHDGCDEIAESQHRRHATEAEYVAIPPDLVSVDQVAHVAVFTCGDHELDLPCAPEDHAPPTSPDPLASACPKCAAAPGASCVKADGRPRRVAHEDRAPAPDPTSVMGGRCDHAHRPDCQGLGACRCSPDDPAPQRPTRGILALSSGAEVADAVGLR